MSVFIQPLNISDMFVHIYHKHLHYSCNEAAHVATVATMWLIIKSIMIINDLAVSSAMESLLDSEAARQSGGDFTDSWRIPC